MNRHGIVRNKLNVVLLCFILFIWVLCKYRCACAHTRTQFSHYSSINFHKLNSYPVPNIQMKKLTCPAFKRPTYILFQSFPREGTTAFLGHKLDLPFSVLYKCTIMVCTFLNLASFDQKFVRFTHIIAGSCILFILIVIMFCYITIYLFYCLRSSG